MQEIIRRMSNTSQEISQQERNNILEDYTDQLMRSGYSIQDIRKYMVQGLVGYE